MPNTPTAEKSPISLPPSRAAISVPAFWPMAMAMELMKTGTEMLAKNLKFVDEEIKIHEEQRPTVATPNVARLDLRTMILREYGRAGGIPTLVDAPYAGHSAMIADYAKSQSLIETLLAHGVGHVVLTDWKSATDDIEGFRHRQLPRRTYRRDRRPGRPRQSRLGFARADGCPRWRRRAFPRR